ncbi:protein of unknown function [Serratia sp. Tan611]|nr:protein of unknown function [Serratia sp. Tan611]
MRGCLCGSEHALDLKREGDEFLSCLYGSESQYCPKKSVHQSDIGNDNAKQSPDFVKGD